METDYTNVIYWVLCGMLYLGIVAIGPALFSYELSPFSYIKSKTGTLIACIALPIIELILLIIIIQNLKTVDNQFSLDNDFHLGFVISFIVQGVVSFFWTKNNSDICPNCGSWNTINGIAEIDSREYSKWETHNNSIRDRFNNKIGSYDSTHLHHYNEKAFLVECKKCGTRFNIKRTYDV